MRKSRLRSQTRAALGALLVCWACSSHDESPTLGSCVPTSAEGGSATEAGAAGAPASGTAAIAGAKEPGNSSAGAAGTGSESAGGGASEIAGSAGTAGEQYDLDAGGAPPQMGPVVIIPNSAFSTAPAPDSKNIKLLPSITQITGTDFVTNGGSGLLTLELSAPLDPPLFVLASDADDGHFNLLASATDQDDVYRIEFKIGVTTRLPSFTVRIAPTDGSGNVGVYQSVIYPVVQSGVGDLRMTLAFDENADLDLAATEPAGFEISYQSPLSPFGGRLAADSNEGCVPNGDNSEEIDWPSGFAPAGSYSVFVTNYDDCDNAPIHYTVTINNNVRSHTFQGRFPAASVGERRLIATFIH